MTHYKENLRDIYFNLFELHKIQESTFGKGKFASFDQESAKEIIENLNKLCTSELATSYEASDREPLKLDDEGNVTLPPALRDSLKAYFADDWHLLDIPEEIGGMGAPPTLSWVAYELVSTANQPMGLYISTSMMARAINLLATEEQKKRFLPNLVNKPWGATMVLTEPDAGSDVGAGTTKAVHVKDDIWEISGVKRFITGGDYDAVENLIHLVLARPEGAGPGTKGLSMFIVPKYWVAEDGSLGERNGAYCTNLEKKLGLKGSATCEMTFGERKPAKGFLVGNVHDGIAQMFHVIEYARMSIGMKSMAVLSTAYLNALEYCKDRVQGPDMLSKDGPKQTIIQHPDVKRQLMIQKSYVEGMRALGYYTAQVSDRIELDEEGPERLQANKDMLDLLLPIVKGFFSEKVFELLSISLQCFGGSGYCQDYPIEQYLRDQKIDTLYEGTTHMQALDFLFRKIFKNKGRAFSELSQTMMASIGSIKDHSTLGEQFEPMATAAANLKEAFDHLAATCQESPYHGGFQGNRFLFAAGQLTCGWQLLESAKIAAAKLDEGVSGADKDFYTGKVAAFRFYCREVLPEVGAAKRVIKQSELSLMELPEAAF